MVRSPTFLRLLIAIVSVAILALPVSAAHLHLCLDGNEPASTLHSVEDGAHHDEGGASPLHNDMDVSLANNALAKKFDRSSELPSLLAAAFVVFRVPLTSAAPVVIDRAATLAPNPNLRLLPPLRAPPV